MIECDNAAGVILTFICFQDLVKVLNEMKMETCVNTFEDLDQDPNCLRF